MSYKNIIECVGVRTSDYTNLLKLTKRQSVFLRSLVQYVQDRQINPQSFVHVEEFSSLFAGHYILFPQMMTLKLDGFVEVLIGKENGKPVRVRLSESGIEMLREKKIIRFVDEIGESFVNEKVENSVDDEQFDFIEDLVKEKRKEGVLL